MSNTSQRGIDGKPPAASRWGVFGCFALVVLFAVLGGLGVSGSFWALLSAGVLMIVGGIIVAIVLYRRGRPR